MKYKQGDLFEIKIERYKTLARVGQFNAIYNVYEGTDVFDRECGLLWHRGEDDKFIFVIDDIKKFLLANLKYNITSNE